MAMDEATRTQVLAADPRRSTWLAANAGAGKTRVLTDRVALLLLSGVPPQSILCLTFTKAAAAEMQNRLFETLGDWAMTPPERLRARLGELGETGPLGMDQLARAQRLFARAIETPGGLKIQTIHAFCASLLRRFPLEAGVSPQFQEMDDTAVELLTAQVADQIASGPQRDSLVAVTNEAGDEEFDAILRELLKHRALFDPPLVRSAIFDHLDLPPGFDADTLGGRIFDGSEAVTLEAAARQLGLGTKTDAALAEKLTSALPLLGTLGGIAALEKALLLGKTAKTPFGSKAGKLGTKATRETMDPAVCRALDDLADRIAEARPLRLALVAAERSVVLHDFAAVFLPAIAAAKQARGWLDFEDLILFSRKLLTRPDVAQWVLYKLDGGISHILVDEAQDTSPEQWEVVRLLAEEIIATAEPDAPMPRTLFVVGDRKQSIYSFQGAAPDEFDAMRARFATSLATQGTALADRALQYSFRSSPAILETVDSTFAALGSHGCGSETIHRAFHGDYPGRVDLWPVLPKPDRDQEEPEWDDPLDRLAPDDPGKLLATQIARTIKGWIDQGESLPLPDGTRRPVRAGDVLILVQRRNALFTDIIAACKNAGLPIAGADRLTLGDTLAVKDLIALLSFLATPEDDLSLACVLRSPLLNWSEDELFRLAHGRSGYLWEALRACDDRPETLSLLWDLLGQTEYLRPYDLLERVLTRHEGRRRLVARLGVECEEAVNALLTTALDYEQREVPTLTGFLTWFGAGDIEIKRQAEASGDALRVMTVHGAKGLEEQIVILPDTAKRPVQNRDRLLRIGDEDWMAWRPTREDLPPPLADAASGWTDRQRQERDRLLYVAMTRARSWLIACGAGDAGETPQDSWHAAIGAGLRQLEATEIETPTGRGLRLARGDWAGGALPDRVDITGSALAELPSWTATQAPEGSPAILPVAPTALGGAKALWGEADQDPEAVLRRGRHLHLLLEHLPTLPEPSWAHLASGLLALDPEPPEPGLSEEILQEAVGVLTDPALAHLFDDTGLAEVEIAAELPEIGQRIRGVIDRLVIRYDHVLAIDFKSNALLPDRPEAVPEGILRQMGAYAAALGQIYPDRRIETSILWTARPVLMPLPHAIVMDALRAAGLPPAQTRAS